MDRTIGLATYPDDGFDDTIYAVCPQCSAQALEGYYDIRWGFLGCDECVDKRWAFQVITEDMDENDENFPEYEVGICPLCDKECEWFYIDNDEIVGCDNCVHICDATECDEFYPEEF